MIENKIYEKGKEPINHIINCRLQGIYSLYIEHEEKNTSLEEFNGIVNDIRHLFIVNIHQAIHERVYSKRYSLEKLREILDKSDFDWTNYNEFNKFVNFVCDKNSRIISMDKPKK